MHNLIYAGYGRWIEATLPKNQSKKLKMHDTHISFPGAWRVVVIAQKHPTFRHAQIKMVRTAFQKLGIKGQVRRGGDEERHYLRGAKEITGPGKVDHSGREFANFLWRTPRGKKYMRQLMWSVMSFADRVARLCPTHKGADNFPFTAPGAKFNLHKQNFPAAVGWLRLNDAATGVHFDLSTDPARIMVKPGKAP